jgi:PTH1 family peptidyl-tRNA hydrolase
MKLVVGLGNPGREYVGTRHNVGFEVIDALARKLGWAFSAGEFEKKARSKFDGLAMDGSLTTASGGSERLLLLKPMTFMNLSGRSVQQALAFYQMAPADMMVVLDEMALPCGKLRIRSGGSDGGHNGLRDIQRALATNQYPRLRIGIDAPAPPIAGKDYVLGKIAETQRRPVSEAVDRATGAIICWIENGIAAAMNRFNAEATETRE